MDATAVIEAILAARGVAPDAFEAFFDPSLRRLASPSELPGVSGAVNAVLPFLSGDRTVVVFGDYDCDGVCATAILVTALRRLGARVEAFIPDRFTEGYGMTPASVSRLLAEHPDVALVVTCDTGINAVDEVASLKARGIAVVVTDHHLPAAVLPAADALIDPKAADPGVFSDLCGAGVAFFFVSACVAEAARLGLYAGGKFSAPLLVLAGLATVADLMPLTGQNRILVASALAAFRESAPVGLRKLVARAQRRGGDLTSHDFGFLLAPRINAAGRIASALEAFDLVMETDPDRADECARRIDLHNVERKSIENGIFTEASAQIPNPVPAAVTVSGENWHTGVAGIVASRLLERLGVPVAVYAGHHGSVRAPEGYNVCAALEAASDALVRFGGHAAAGGFSVKEGRLGDFRRFFAEACAAQKAARPASAESDDGPRGALELAPADITLGLAQELRRLEPFGEGNPDPVFVLRGADVKSVSEMGRNQPPAERVHLSVAFADSEMPRGVWWGALRKPGGAAIRDVARGGGRFDVWFTLHVSDWGGVPAPEMTIVEMRTPKG